MKRNVEIPLPIRVKIALDCARVYLYMHNLGIVHRDIKSHNVLIDSNYNVKVCDFGLARFIVSAPSKHHVIIKLTNNPFLCRLTWERERCSMRERRATWHQSCSRREPTTRKLMCLPLALFCGRQSSARYPSMDLSQARSEPRLRQESNSEPTTDLTTAFSSSSPTVEICSPAQDLTSLRSCKLSHKWLLPFVENCSLYLDWHALQYG